MTCSKYSHGLPLTFVVAALAGWSARAQEVAPASWTSHVVVPQARSYAMDRRAAVTIEQVRAGVVIRGQAATTLVEIHLRNPTPGRLEAELLRPVPDDAVVRGFSYAGSNREPTARVLPREEARLTYDRLVSSTSDPALLEFAGSNLIRSSVFPVEGNGTQIVRLTFENLLQADADRVDYVLPRSESVEYRVPWKVSVQIVAPVPIAAVYSASHAVRTSRTSANVAKVEVEVEVEPGASTVAERRPTPMSSELVEEIVHLSTEFGILTESTAFLALESTDLSRKGDLEASAGDLLRSRAMQTRSGYASANQDINNQSLKGCTTANPLNRFLLPDLSESATSTVQQVCDLAFFKRGDRWVDSRLIAEQDDLRPRRAIAFGSEEFRELAARLSREGRQGSISLRGDILILIDGQPVLIQAPVDRPKSERP